MGQQNRYPEAIIPGTATKATLIAATTYARGIGELAFASDKLILNVAETQNAGAFMPVGVRMPIKAVIAVYDVIPSDFTITCDGTFAVNLHTAVGYEGVCHNIANIGAGIISLTANGVQVIGNNAPTNIDLIYPGEVRNIQSNNANWIYYS